VAHEAIFRRRDKLREWIAAEREFLAWRNGLEAARRAWKDTPEGAKNEALLMGLPLANAQTWLAKRAGDINEIDSKFIVLSRRGAQRRQRRVQVLVGALLALLTLGSAGWWKQNLLREQYHWHIAMGPSVLTVEQEKEKAAKPRSEFKECATGCPTMVVVPAGKFMMGSPESEKDRHDDEGPQHEVTIPKPFAVGKTEVTFAEWDICFAAGACSYASDVTLGRGDRPVINVSWDDAKQYVGWLSRISGKKYRLLSEAEWEYAARAGSQTRFSFGDDEAQLDQHAWYASNSFSTMQPVGKKAANAFGLYDMHGNVDEWVEDTLHQYNGAPTDSSPWVDGDFDGRVIRGGHFQSESRYLRAASRRWLHAGGRDGILGFRLARTLNP
jgi:formylglycine-generating enzyme required for sulfatase activity